MAETIGQHSWEENNGKLNTPMRDNESLNNDLLKSFNQLKPKEHNHDTVFHPNVQAGWTNVNIEVFLYIHKNTSVSFLPFKIFFELHICEFITKVKKTF